MVNAGRLILASCFLEGKTMSRHTLVALAAAIFLLMGGFNKGTRKALASPQDPLSVAEFEKLHAELQPPKDPHQGWLRLLLQGDRPQLLLIGATAAAGQDSKGPEPLTMEEFRRIRSGEMTTPDPFHDLIPWRASLLEALQTAEKDNKPIVILQTAGNSASHC